MNAAAALRIERLNYILGGAATAAAALLMSKDIALGVLVGAAISALNFSVLRRLIGRLLSGEGSAAAGILLIPKMLGLAVAIALAIYYLPASPIAIAAGFSVFLVSIAVETIRFLTSPSQSHG